MAAVLFISNNALCSAPQGAETMYIFYVQNKAKNYPPIVGLLFWFVPPLSSYVSSPHFLLFDYLTRGCSDATIVSAVYTYLATSDVTASRSAGPTQFVLLLCLRASDTHAYLPPSAILLRV